MRECSGTLFSTSCSFVRDVHIDHNRQHAAMGLLRSLTLQRPVKEVAHEHYNFIALILQRKVASVKKVQLSVGKIVQVRIRAISLEYLIILSPHDEIRRPPCTKELLELWVRCNVRTIVLE